MVLNVSSVGGIFGVPMMSVYSASKFALEGFSEALRYELASQNIAVKLVEPHEGVTGNDFNARLREEKPEVNLSDYQAFTKPPR
jgi:short-subunit dehydrogenase